MSLRKKYQKTGGPCAVTFSMPKAGVASVRTATGVGDFNGWNQHGIAIKKQENGSFSASVTLGRGTKYQFRYGLNGERRENEWNPDKYLTNEQGSENSAVIVWGETADHRVVADSLGPDSVEFCCAPTYFWRRNFSNRSAIRRRFAGGGKPVFETSH